MNELVFVLYLGRCWRLCADVGTDRSPRRNNVGSNPQFHPHLSERLSG